MNLRKGKTKTILKSALDAALLAVEVYNKPRTTFRSETYIILMIIAWTRLFHAYFNTKIGDKYYYRKKYSNRYKIIDGERKAWELTTCVKEFGELNESVKKNLEFFIGLRNKIEHRHIDKREVDTLIFGECQAMLFNFENTIVKLFGEEYALQESLVYSLQFSHLRKQEQKTANKSALSKDVQDITKYVEMFRSTLTDEIFDSQEFSIKLIQIPRISNTNRSDLAIEFVHWDDLKQEDRDAYEQIATIIKDRKIKIEGANIGRLKPKAVKDRVNEAIPGSILNYHTHMCLYRLFDVRPQGNAEDPFETNTKFCYYDEPHDDYVYTDDWPEFIIDFLQSRRVSGQEIHDAYRQGEKWDIDDLESIGQ